MVYGETGRYSLSVNAKLRSVRFWLRIMKMHENRLPRQVYSMMMNLPDEFNMWTTQIKKILIENGFENVWNAQRVDEERVFLKSLRTSLVNKFMSEWNMKLSNSDRYSFYRQYKGHCQVERYLFVIDKKCFRDLLVRFRLGISDLFQYKMRYCAEFVRALCPLCREEDEDEIHFLFRCPALCDLRIQYILPFVNVPHANLLSILLSDDVDSLRALSSYLYKAFKRREEAVESVERDAFYLD